MARPTIAAWVHDNATDSARKPLASIHLDELEPPEFPSSSEARVELLMRAAASLPSGWIGCLSLALPLEQTVEPVVSWEAFLLLGPRHREPPSIYVFDPLYFELPVDGSEEYWVAAPEELTADGRVRTEFSSYRDMDGRLEGAPFVNTKWFHLFRGTEVLGFAH